MSELVRRHVSVIDGESTFWIGIRGGSKGSITLREGLDPNIYEDFQEDPALFSATEISFNADCEVNVRFSEDMEAIVVIFPKAPKKTYRRRMKALDHLLGLLIYRPDETP